MQAATIVNTCIQVLREVRRQNCDDMAQRWKDMEHMQEKCEKLSE